MKRHLELGLETEALEICKGLVLGCYRLSERAGGDVLGWAPDFPGEAAGHALESGIAEATTLRIVRAEKSGPTSG